MKKLLLALTLLASATSFAANITRVDIQGISVASIDIDGPFYVVQLIVNENGTYNYRDANIDTPMAKPGCSGTYSFKDSLFTGELDCSAIGGPRGIVQTVNFSNVTADQLNSETGASVMVKSSIVGDYEMPFKLVKRSELYFQD